MILVLLSLVSAPYFVRKMTFEGYGLYVLFTGLVGYYNLLDLGLGQSVIKFVAQYLASGEEGSLNKAINTAFTVQMSIGAAGFFCAFLLAKPILNLLNTPESIQGDGLISLYACALGFLVSMSTGTFGSALMGLQRYDITSKVNVGTGSLLVVSIALALWFGFGFREAILITVFFSLFTGAAYFVILRRLLPNWKLSLHLNSKDIKEVFRFSGFIFVSQISNFFSGYLVRVVISVFVGPAAVTMYTIPSKLIGAFGGVLSSGFAVLFPYASALGSTQNNEDLRESFLQGSKFFASLSVPIFLLICVFARPILSFWMDEQFAEEAWPVLRVLALSGLIGSLTTVPNLMTLGIGHARIIGRFSVLTLLLYCILLPTFTIQWNLFGTTWAMLLSTLPGVLLVRHEAKHIFKIQLMEFMRTTMGFHVLPIALVAVVLAFDVLPIQGIQSGWNLLMCFGLAAIYLAGMSAKNWIPLRDYVIHSSTQKNVNR